MTTGPTSQIALAIFPRLLEGSPSVVAPFRTVPFRDAQEGWKVTAPQSGDLCTSLEARADISTP